MKNRKLFVVSRRFGETLAGVTVHTSRKDAKKAAKEYIKAAVLKEYDGNSENPSDPTLKRWIDTNGYQYYDFFFWDGATAASEAVISEIPYEIIDEKLVLK